MAFLALALFFTPIVLFVIRVWRRQGMFSAGERWGLITSFAGALTSLILARLVINWVLMPPAIWSAAVALLASGVIGAGFRWSALPWFTRSPRRWRSVRIAGTLVLCALTIGIALA